MFFLALATDYDGTIATDGVVASEIVQALHQFKAGGRRLILVTGRELPDLIRAFPEYSIFDRVVAENGAVLHDPSTKLTVALATPPAKDFVEALRAAKVEPLSVGEVIVATWEPNQTTVLEAIKTLGLELQIIFNKGAVMVLPPNINKATGLKAALDDLGLSPVNVVGVGDAENDHAFMALCGCSAAVSNALSQIKNHSDIVLSKARGEGVKELMEMIFSNDGEIVSPIRHGIALGVTDYNNEVILPTLGGNILITGHSAVGKSTIATALTERMTEKQLQFVVIDPEGDFEKLEHATQIGDGKSKPSLIQLEPLFRDGATNAVVNALAVPLDERPEFFAETISMVSKVRLSVGHPHWVIVDEAHHVLPDARENVRETLPDNFAGCIFITVHPESVSRSALEKIQFLISAGPEANELIAEFCEKVECAPPQFRMPCGDHDVLLWDRQSPAEPICLTPNVPAQIHRRHTRKYAEGELGPDKSFYFRGADGRLNLRAQNLLSFLNIADGVDDETWEYHLRRHDYSAWFRSAVKDDDLAAAVEAVEESSESPGETRAHIRSELEARYTAPATSRAD